MSNVNEEPNKSVTSEPFSGIIRYMQASVDIAMLSINRGDSYDETLEQLKKNIYELQTIAENFPATLDEWIEQIPPNLTENSDLVNSKKSL